MMRLISAEFRKLFYQPFFLLLMILLLVGNIFTLDRSAGKTSKGDLTESQETYASFLEQVPVQTEKLEESADGESAFYRRNLAKTREDYGKVHIPKMQKGDYRAIYSYAKYFSGLWFSAIFVLLLSNLLVQSERKRGFYLLTKVCRCGHGSFAEAKYLTGLLTLLLVLLLQEGSGWGLLLFRYGPDPLTSGIQTLEIFRNTSGNFTILQTVFYMFLVRFLCLIVFFSIAFSLQLLFRRSGIAEIITAAFLVLELFFSLRLTSDSTWNGLWAVNLFTQWNMEAGLGVYLNLNLFGFPLSMGIVSLAFGTLLSATLLTAGICVFSRSFQIAGESPLERLALFFRSRIFGRIRSARVTAEEWKKVLLHQHRWLVLLVLFFLVLCSFRYVNRDRQYAEVRIGAYHGLLSQCSGKVTERSLRFIEDQRKEQDVLSEKMQSLDPENADDRIQMEFLSIEYQRMEEGLEMVESQRDSLSAMDGGLQGKYLLDEYSYLNEFRDYRSDVLFFLASGILLLLLTCSLESFDSQRKMMGLLGPTKTGTEGIRRAKKDVFWILSLVSFFSMQLPEIWSYYRIDQGRCFGSQMQWFTSESFRSSMAIGTVLFLCFLIRLAIFSFFSLFVEKAVFGMKQSAIVFGIGLMILAALGILCFGFHISVPVLLLKLL